MSAGMCQQGLAGSYARSAEMKVPHASGLS
jgi:hypothetical protein